MPSSFSVEELRELAQVEAHMELNYVEATGS